MIANKPIFYLTIIALVFSSFTAFASGEETSSKEGQINTPEGIKEYIKHHLADSHDFALYSYTNDVGERKHLGFPLPVIVWTSKGLKSFMSSAFHHNDDGHVIVDKGNVKLVIICTKLKRIRLP